MLKIDKTGHRFYSIFLTAISMSGSLPSQAKSAINWQKTDLKWQKFAIDCNIIADCIFFQPHYGGFSGSPLVEIAFCLDFFHFLLLSSLVKFQDSCKVSFLDLNGIQVTFAMNKRRHNLDILQYQDLPQN